MNFGEALEELRADILDDNRQPYFWLDPTIMRFYNKAIVEATIRAPLLKKSYDIAITSALGATYDINADVRLIEKATLSDDSVLTLRTNVELTDKYGNEWEEDTGTPTAYVRSGNTIRLYPIPDANETVTLATINKAGDSEIVYGTGDEAGIPAEYHDGLLNWVAYLCFRNPDLDAGRRDRAQEHFALFEAQFGKRKTAAYDVFSQNIPLHSRVLPGRFAV